MQKAAVLSRVKELDIERQNLEREISLARRLEPLPEDDSDAEEVSSTNDIFCFTCGHQVNSSTALKHIERCFSKIETQTSYESKYPSNIPMLFCDAYNNRTKSFCKRLKIICPEHSAKDYKVADDEVCGCPLPNPGEVIFNDKVPHEYCRVLKRRCLKHYKWEIMRIATIDAERVNSLIKYDELLESESKVESGIKTRGSVLDLLLNSCEAHWFFFVVIGILARILLWNLKCYKSFFQSFEIDFSSVCELIILYRLIHRLSLAMKI